MCHVLLQTEKEGEFFFSRVKKEGHSKIFNGCRIVIIENTSVTILLQKIVNRKFHQILRDRLQ